MLQIASALVFTVYSLLLSETPDAAALSGQVFSVESGDRIILKTAEGQLRPGILLGIEAPLMNTPAGKTARRFLHGLTAGKYLSVDFHALTPRAEILGTLLHGGADINLRLIESGLVRLSADSSLKPERRRTYRQAQQQAQKHFLGIWSRYR